MHKAASAKRRTLCQRAKPVSADVSITFFALCKSIDSPHSLALWLCYKYDHEAFVELTFDPGNYGDAQLAFVNKAATPQAFAYDLLCQEYLSKYKGLRLKRDLKATAISAFKLAECRMESVNRTLRGFRVAQTPRLEAIISIARRKISDILGLRADSDLQFGWGPGATFSIKKDVGWDKKILEQRISVTASALPLASAVIGADIHWCRARGIESEGACTLLPSEFDVVPGNRITTVPKNAKTDRTIAIEPTANIYLQKGIGSWIRRRLKKCCRIDLDDQSVNQKFAGRLDYATIDLKGASDSVSEQVVRLLFPEEWVSLLDVTRSPCYKMDKRWHSYQKWSSMGNGYTFELETLVFYALCYAVQSIDSDRPHVIVYGDDILVPVDHAEQSIACLEAFGFQTNLKKTHYKYLYRESCGAHFFNGILVTPVYQKEVPDHVAEIYHMANRLRHVAARLGGYHYSDTRIRSAWLSAVNPLKAASRLWHTPLCFSSYYSSTVRRSDGPRKGDVEPLNDSYPGTLHLSIEDCVTLNRPVLAYGFKTKCLLEVSKKRPFDSAAGLALVISNSSSFEGKDELSMRGRGATRQREVRCYRAFGSNAWL